MLVALSPRARMELDAALDYHSDRGAAVRFNQRVEELLLQMQRFPQAARVRPDFTSRDVRFWLVAPFWFVTQHTSDQMLIITVVHASQDMRAHLRTLGSNT